MSDRVGQVYYEAGDINPLVEVVFRRPSNNPCSRLLAVSVGSGFPPIILKPLDIFSGLVGTVRSERLVHVTRAGNKVVIYICG